MNLSRIFKLSHSLTVTQDNLYPQIIQRLRGRARGVGRPKSDGGRGRRKTLKPLKSIVPESGADRALAGHWGREKIPSAAAG